MLVTADIVCYVIAKAAETIEQLRPRSCDWMSSLLLQPLTVVACTLFLI